MSKEGKKSRMTPERYKLLDELGFKWSSPTPARARRNKQVGKKSDGGGEEQKEAGNVAPVKPEAEEVGAAAAVVEKVVEVPTAAEAEAITAASNVVGNLSAVVAANEENHGFVEEAIVGKVEAVTEAVAQGTAPENGIETVGVDDTPAKTEEI